LPDFAVLYATKTTHDSCASNYHLCLFKSTKSVKKIRKYLKVNDVEITTNFQLKKCAYSFASAMYDRTPDQ